MEKRIVKNALDKNKIKRPVLKNSIKAFVVGGLIAIIAQGLLDLYMRVFELDKSTSTSMMSITLVFIASILTGIGVYDKIGQLSGAGTIIPITGFSNSMTSAALESKSEGVILGIMTNMFKLAGAVIVAGVVSSFVFGTLIYLVGLL
ncbi:MAG: stage V sporulation protein AC [Bacilli bacterium]|nr:stage V sporulation protein AC [Bacilli bacterium]